MLLRKPGKKAIALNTASADDPAPLGPHHQHYGKSESDRLNAAFSVKAAVHAWAKGLSRDIGKYGITVNSIPPGRIMSEQIRRNYPEEYRKSHAAAEIPAGAYGEPEDLAVLTLSWPRRWRTTSTAPSSR